MAGPDFSQTIGQRAVADSADPLVAPNVPLWVALAIVMWVLVTWLGGQPPPLHAGLATFDLERDLAKATVQWGSGRSRVACPWSPEQRRFTCGAEPWGFVGPYGGHTAGKHRRCTWVHPLAGGAPTVLTWPKRPLGAHLFAAIGLVDEAGAGTPLQLQVFVAGTLVLTLQSTDARQLAERELPVPPGPPDGELRLEVQSRDHTLRMGCIDVRMRGQRLATQAIDATLPALAPPSQRGAP